MTATSSTNKYSAIIKAATAGFLLYGYDGFSMQACADAVEMQKGSLYYHVRDKLDLAHKVLADVTKQATLAICANQWPFGLSNGLQLAVLPARLWVSGDRSLQTAIVAYYQDWCTAFIGDAFTTTIPNNACLQGHIGFFAWMGFWLCQQMGLRCDELMLLAKTIAKGV